MRSFIASTKNGCNFSLKYLILQKLYDLCTKTKNDFSEFYQRASSKALILPSKVAAAHQTKVRMLFNTTAYTWWQPNTSSHKQLQKTRQ